MNKFTQWLNEWKEAIAAARKPETALTLFPEVKKKGLTCEKCLMHIRRGDRHRIIMARHLDCDNPRGGK